ncbi:hypothetical protein BHM03_00008131, partial [Ensete ventricosum]
GVDDREQEVAGSESHVEERNLEEIHPSRERVVLSSGFQLHDIRQQYVFVSCVTLAAQALANANSFLGLGTRSFFGSLVLSFPTKLLMLGCFVFVLSGLSHYTSDEDFENMFSRFGRVVTDLAGFV